MWFPSRLKSLSTFVCLVLAPIAQGGSIDPPIGLSIEVTIAGVEPQILQGRAINGIPTEFKLDKTYSIAVQVDIVELEGEDSLLLEVRFYQRGKHILSPSYFGKSGDVFAYTADANTTLPSNRRKNPIVEQFRVRATILDH